MSAPGGALPFPQLGTAQLILTTGTVLLCVALFVVVIVARVRGIHLPRWAEASNSGRVRTAPPDQAVALVQLRR